MGKLETSQALKMIAAVGQVKRGGGLGDFSKKQRSRDLDRLIWERLLLVKVAVIKISSSKAPDLRRTLTQEDSVKCVDR